MAVGLLAADAPEPEAAEPPPELLLDDHLEHQDRWRLESADPTCNASGRATVAVEDGQGRATPRMLVITWKRDLGDLGGRGVHSTPIAPCCALELPEKHFVVRDAESGAEVLKGWLRFLRSALGTYKTADFTLLTDPGRYVVEIGEMKSLPFMIGDDIYRRPIEMLSDWVFNMRCGCRIGLHPPSHTDDATLVTYEGSGKERREVSRRHLDLNGGWHDAGDVRTYYNYTCWLAHQFLRARESGWDRDRDGDGIDDLMLELPDHPDYARWRAALIRASN